MTDLERLIEQREALRHQAECLKQEYNRLDALVESLDGQLKAAEEARDNIKSNGFRGADGQLPDVERELAQTEILIADEQKPVVHWVEGTRSSWDRDDYVVDKVTAKQIYARRKGHANCIVFQHNGLPIGGYSHRIDIAKTFPQGVRVTK